MRPQSLTPLFAGIRELDGIGPKLEKLLARLLSLPAETPPRIVDLVWHLPSGLIDRRARPKIADAPDGEIVTLEVTVGEHKPGPRGGRAPYRVFCFDDTGQIELVFFHAHADYLKTTLPEGRTRFLSGVCEHFGGRLQMSHPDHILSPEEFATMPPVEPVYPMTAGLASKTLRKAIGQALERVGDYAEWQDPGFLQKQGWAGFKNALHAAHLPQSKGELALLSPDRARLAFDELLANQLALMLVRAHMRKTAGRGIEGNGHIASAIRAALPFSLTRGQEDAAADIAADMAKPARMLRLLQGDVGSGKTVVALLAMALAAEAGLQSALMAPTELLARQHLATLTPLCEAAGLTVNLLTSREKGKTRADILKRLASGDIDILIGTHALFQEGVAFNDLALAVIDEQHRFGVHQRLALQAKGGQAVDLLVMTATPIPRSLTLTLYGDMDVSLLKEKPAGRQPVETRVMPLERLDELAGAVGRAIAGGALVYWICPLVEATEHIQASAAQDRAAWLKKRFGDRVGLVHGRLGAQQKDEVMAAFRAGDLDILVATTVVEVGVDVPRASVMVIEHAERFGLAQLHQLRGRIGRGADKSTCLLLYQGPLGETAEARLRIMRETEDGFVIAEEDLRLRGAGEMLGSKQSGLPDYHIADLSVHGELLAAARDDARLLLQKDPDLKGPRGDPLRLLLYLFGHDRSARLPGAG